MIVDNQRIQFPDDCHSWAGASSSCNATLQSVKRHAAAMVDHLVVVGDEAAPIADGASAAGLPAAAIDQVRDRDAALEVLLGRLRPGDTVLVKASRGASLDLLVDRLVLAARASEGSA